jgi:N-acetylmuramoyl-L-alanine amidase/Domain of unknown function (DUF4280)
MTTEEHNKLLEEKRAKKKKQANEPKLEEKREVVMHGATLKCPYAQVPGKLVVTSNELELQDQLWGTEGDGNNMVNLQFEGICGHPKWPQRKMTPPPCRSAIKLTPWENLGTFYVQEQKNLVKESTIKCDPEFNAACALPIPKVESIQIRINRILDFQVQNGNEINLFDVLNCRVTKFEFPPTEEDKKAVSWQIDYGINKQDLIHFGDVLNLNVNHKDTYNSEFNIYAYLIRPRLDLTIKVKVKPIVIISRSEWGAIAPQTGGNYSYEIITTSLREYYDTIVIHHSGNAKHFPTVKDIQKEHMNQMDKADIGYHFAVDKDGKIYEGRPINVKGAHVDKANTGKIGIVLLGDLSTDNAGVDEGMLGYFKLREEKKDGDDYITDEMEKSVLRLCIHLDRLYDINVVGGHMEIASSASTDERHCPGNLTMAKMDQWRTILEKRKP